MERTTAFVYRNYSTSVFLLVSPASWYPENDSHPIFLYPITMLITFSTLRKNIFMHGDSPCSDYGIKTLHICSLWPFFCSHGILHLQVKRQAHWMKCGSLLCPVDQYLAPSTRYWWISSIPQFARRSFGIIVWSAPLYSHHDGRHWHLIKG